MLQIASKGMPVVEAPVELHGADAANKRQALSAPLLTEAPVPVKTLGSAAISTAA